VDRRSGIGALTGSAWTLLEGLRAGFAAGGVTDAVSLVVDGEALYADDQAVPDDLDLVMELARRSHAVERPFDALRLVLGARREALFVLFDVAVHRLAALGEAELVIEVSGRPELTPRHGEGDLAYTARVEAFATRDVIESMRLAFERFTADLTAVLARLLDGAAVSAAPTWIALPDPGEDAAARLPALPFGAPVLDGAWHPVPDPPRPDAADPFDYYFRDPYWELTRFLVHRALGREPERRHPLIPAGGEPGYEKG
nr:hypothetical protein [Deltaproteobacteria bacterium]